MIKTPTVSLHSSQNQTIRRSTIQLSPYFKTSEKKQHSMRKLFQKSNISSSKAFTTKLTRRKIEIETFDLLHSPIKIKNALRLQAE